MRKFAANLCRRQKTTGPLTRTETIMPLTKTMDWEYLWEDMLTDHAPLDANFFTAPKPIHLNEEPPLKWKNTFLNVEPVWY